MSIPRAPRLIALGLALAALVTFVSAQSPASEAETDPLVLAKLARWQDWKFGLMMHWGP